MRLLLILVVFAYSFSSNMLINDRLDNISKDISGLRVEYNKEIHPGVQRIMDIYGTRLTLVEKKLKESTDFMTLNDLIAEKG